MTISVRKNYTKHQLLIEEKILSTLESLTGCDMVDGEYLLIQLRFALEKRQSSLQVSKEDLMKTVESLPAANSFEASGGILMTELKHGVLSGSPNLRVSRTMLKDIVDDLVVSGQVEIVNPGNYSWVRVRISETRERNVA